MGSGPGLPPLTLPPSSVTIIVGPNNSGKSLLLRELDGFLRADRRTDEFKILGSVSFDPESVADCRADIDQNTCNELDGEQSLVDHCFYSRNGEKQQFHIPILTTWLKNPTVDARFFKTYVKFNTIKLDGPNRIALVADKPLSDLTHTPQNRLAQLFRNRANRYELRRVVFEAIQAHLVVDPTKLGHVRLRLSTVAPASDIEEEGIHGEAVEFHKRSLYIGDASDGIKAFCGILIELYAGDPKVLLIDEPEAFLHPSLAFLLGKAAAAKAQTSGKQLIFSTHSAHFLMGCIQSGAAVNVVRLTYSGGRATARLLPNEQLVGFMRNPLLRSAGVLNGLFYEGVMVTEGDTDRAFYNEINERLLFENLQRGSRNCLFLNAQNKQTVRLIISLLRGLGIAAAGIVDIDVLKEGGNVWGNFLKSGGFPDATIAALALVRANLNTCLVATGKDMKRDGGIALLADDDLRAAIDLFDQLDGYGLFVVRGGEVESWLRELGINGHAANWLIPMFQRLGENPRDSNYVHAGKGDVWEFLTKISRWIANPERKGLH